MTDHEVITVNPLAVPYRTGSYLISDEGAENNFRSGMDLSEYPYRASGSHQLGVVDFVAVLGEKVVEPYSPDTLYLVDLRQETHGFFRGSPVSWYADNDFGNVGMAADLIEAEEKWRLHAYKGKVAQIFTITDDAADDLDQERVLPLSYTEEYVRSVRTEKEVAELLSDVFSPTEVKYVRIPVTDHCAPLEDAILSLEQVRPNEDDWVHFHCHGGDGRTTMFLALYDMLRWWRRNGRLAPESRVPLPALEDFVARQCQLFPYCLNPVGCGDCGKATTGWKASLAQNRWQAIVDFYQLLLKQG